MQATAVQRGQHSTSKSVPWIFIIDIFTVHLYCLLQISLIVHLFLALPFFSLSCYILRSQQFTWRVLLLIGVTEKNIKSEPK